MYIPKRDSSMSKKNEIFIIVFVAIIFPLGICAIGVLLARYLRKRNCEPKYLPGQFLKNKWKQWTPGGSASYGSVPSQPASRPRDTSYRGAARSRPEMSHSGVQRDTSIRSVMTLPSYSANPNPTEQIIGREGERAGMDSVVEFPETTEEEELRREEQMDALYQIRVQRRQQIADREARRQERRDARARGDALRMDLLNRESRHGRTRPSAAAIIAEHRERERNRRIASVSYAEIGQVRHDGTRLRADSDSDSRPLLQSASSPSLNDPLTLQLTQQSFASSTRTADTDSGGTELDPLVLATTATHDSTLSSRSILHIDEEDLGEQGIPPPPEYDHLEWGDAPAYESESAESPEGPEPERPGTPEDSVNTEVSRSPESPFRGQPREPRPFSDISVPDIHIDMDSPMLSPFTPTVSNTDLDQEPTTPTSPLQYSNNPPATPSPATEHTPVSP